MLCPRCALDLLTPCVCGRVVFQGIGTQHAYAAEKWKFPKLIFFDIVTGPNDHPSYVKHVLGSIYVFFYGYWVFVCGGMSSKGLVQNLLMPLSPLGCSKLEVFENRFFDIMTIHHDLQS